MSTGNRGRRWQPRAGMLRLLPDSARVSRRGGSVWKAVAGQFSTSGSAFRIANLFSSSPPLPFSPLVSAPARSHCLPNSLFSCCWIPSYVIAVPSVVALAHCSPSALIPCSHLASTAYRCQCPSRPGFSAVYTNRKKVVAGRYSSE